MDNQELSSSQLPEQHQTKLKEELFVLQEELATLEQQITSFETSLRAALAEEIIEEQELTVLYKQLKQAKKQKRLEQKKRGKNYKEPTGVKISRKEKEDPSTPENDAELKRLYREAMLNVHPDKFNLEEEYQELATEITSKLIDIYKSGDLEELQSFHTHIMSGNALGKVIDPILTSQLVNKDSYLLKEIQKVKDSITKIRNKHTYKVLTEYENPLSFIDELKTYYKDRISKLKKRTRKA
jgi:hypothetical protein